MTEDQIKKLSKKKLKAIINDTVEESDWSAEDLFRICVLPYLDQSTMATIVINHCVDID